MRVIPAFVAILGGALVIWTAWRGRVGKLKRNYFVGIRLPSTLRSDAAWAAAHRVSWIYTALAGGSLAAWGIWVIFDEDAVYWLIWFVFLMLIFLIASIIRARAAAITAYRLESDGS